MKYRKIVGGLLLGIVAAFLIGGAANAAGSFKTGDSTNLAKGEKVNSSLYISGNNVTVAGIVDGDVFCAGQNVSITGTVHGDVICAGQNLRVDGNVQGDVRLAGQTVNLSGKVKDNATIAAQTFTADAKSKVGGDATIMSQDATLSGNIGRDLVANGDTITINGNIARDINGDMKQLELNKGSVVGGSIAYTSQHEANQSDGAKVAGNVQRSEPENNGDHNGFRSLAPLAKGLWLYGLISMLIVSLAVVLIFPRQVGHTAEYVLARPGRTILVGIIASFVVPLTILALMITLIGIPLALLVLLVWALLLFLSGPVLGYVVGRLLLRDSTQPVPIMLLGSFIVTLLYLVPILGFFVMLAAVWFGTGALLSAAYDVHQQKKIVKKRKA